VIGWYADQHRQHIERLRELADRDFLTGLVNARVFDEALARRCAGAEPFALVLADMDDLKHVNDAGESSLELFRKADDRLYAAKLLGRNRRAVTTLAAAANQ
jgi:GGDEF domain-containing protein